MSPERASEGLRRVRRGRQCLGKYDWGHVGGGGANDEDDDDDDADSQRLQMPATVARAGSSTTQMFRMLVLMPTTAKNSIDRFCVMQEAFGKERYVIEETFESIYTFCC